MTLRTCTPDEAASYLWPTFARFRWCNTHHCVELQPIEGYWPHGTCALQCWKNLKA